MNDLMMIIIAGILGAILTFYISENYKMGPVQSSSLLTFSIGLLFYFFPHFLNPYLTKNIPVVFMGTSFIGMVSAKYYGSYFRLSFAGIIFSIIYGYKSLFFEGFGGALGALSFISLLTVISIPTLLLRKTKMKRIYVRIKTSFLAQRK